MTNLTLATVNSGDPSEITVETRMLSGYTSPQILIECDVDSTDDLDLKVTIYGGPDSSETPEFLRNIAKLIVRFTGDKAFKKAWAEALAQQKEANA